MFFRKSDVSPKPPLRGSSAAKEQLRELRIKARRRLIGALFLVLLAFILVPWLFDQDPEPAVAPEVVAALAPPLAAPEPQEDTLASGVIQQEPGAQEAESPPQAPPLGQAPEPVPEPPPLEPQAGSEPAVAPAPAPAPQNPAPGPEQAPATPAPPKPSAPPPKPEPVRTDDGSEALALLEGRAPPKAAPASSAGSSRFFLQVAAYGSEQDAASRRDSLRQAGVSDAYVEQAQSGGRTVYRLRVGPFGSYEAAQAAQTRLRSLGYQNGMISGK